MHINMSATAADIQVRIETLPPLRLICREFSEAVDVPDEVQFVASWRSLVDGNLPYS